jgi:membrane-associated phospholipid phosphatase
MQYLIHIDRQLLKYAYQGRFIHIFPVKLLIFMGDGPFWMLVVFIAAITGQILKIASFNEVAVQLILGLSIGQVLFALLKTNVRRSRPYANLELQQDLQIEIQNRDPGHGSKEFESFPSGHVYWTTICVSIICVQYGLLAVFLFGWMIPTMLYLRPHLGVHYPSDTIAGLVLGGIIVFTTLLAAQFVLDFISVYQEQTIYLICYWTFISVFLIVGYISWQKRV